MKLEAAGNGNSLQSTAGRCARLANRRDRVFAALHGLIRVLTPIRRARLRPRTREEIRGRSGLALGTGQCVPCGHTSLPRTHLTGVLPGFFNAFSAPTTTSRMPAARPSAERSRPAIAASRLSRSPGLPQAGLAILRRLHPHRSARAGPLQTSCRRRPPPPKPQSS